MAADEGRSVGLPPLWAGRRRRLLVGLVLTGCGQAGVAAATAWLLSRGFDHPLTRARVLSVVGLVGLAMVLGALRWCERVLAERLGQRYVHQVRQRLIRRALTASTQPSLGVTLVRSSNDLTAVRNWVALGVAPLAVAVPLVLGATGVLMLLDPLVAVAMVVPLLLLGAAFAALSRPAYRRSRALRRARGRLSSHLADTVLAAAAIRAAGGTERELRRLKRRSTFVVDSAVKRAGMAGWIRASAAGAGGLALAAVVGACLVAGLGATTLAAAVTVVGLVAAPVQELGRVVEYRQAFRAARRILGSVLAQPADTDSGGEPPRTGRHTLFRRTRGLLVTDLQVGDDETALLQLDASPGARVLVTGDSRGRVQRVLATLAAVHQPSSGSVLLDGVDLSRLDDTERRRRLGYVTQAMRLERGTLLRAARYRRPDCGDDDVEQALRRVGLTETLHALPEGLNTELRQGGAPLDTQERALLLLARALLGSPALLILDHVDADLGPRAMAQLQAAVCDFPGITVAAGHDTGYLCATQRWDVH
jgi:ABC-type multidrug transport system fused ATPase/permease subunit